MHRIMMLRDNLEEELEKFSDRQINEQNLDIIDKLSHSIKCIDTFMAMEKSSRDEYSGRAYHDGYSGRRYYYTQRDGGMSGLRRRDSLGRYADGYSGGYSHDEAKDRLMNEMQGMMGDVSPEAQHAIQKALNALGNE